MKNNKTNKPILSLLSLLLFCALLLHTVGCGMSAQAEDLMKDIKANPVTGHEPDQPFVQNVARFSVNLFQNSFIEGDNSLISPLSLLLALAMATNGADDQTKAQLEAILCGDGSLDMFNETLYTFVKSLPSEKTSQLQIANSIWFRDNGGFEVEHSFLQKNADYYGADVYASPFNKQTLKDINYWISEHTDGMIEQAIQQIDSELIMLLINALTFDAEWEVIYSKSDVQNATFTNMDQTQQKAEMMYADEWSYLSDEQATGFIKPYKNNHYSFVALLPNENISLEDYIASMTGERFVQTIQNAQSGKVETGLPKFSYEYSNSIVEALKKMGVTDAFESSLANFSKLGHSSAGNLFMSDIIHKTFISVDEQGTKAGATSAILMEATSESQHTVILNRPIVYAIVENQTHLPLFLGAVTHLETR